MAAKEAEILGKYLPENSIAYCHSLWKNHSIQLKITRPRKSIYGNYFFRNGAHHITVNGNLSQEAFLVTFLHEVAHLLVRKKHYRRVKPHGTEWQKEFSAVIQPMLIPEVFPEPVLSALKRHMQSPAASSCSDPGLHSLLSGESATENKKKVSDLEPGQHFLFQGRAFIWLKKLRTRCECRCLQSGRIYRVSSAVLVEITEATELAEEKDRGESNDGIRLNQLRDGQRFRLENRLFKKLELKRKRVLCEEISSGRRYVIQGEVQVRETDLC